MANENDAKLKALKLTLDKLDKTYGLSKFMVQNLLVKPHLHYMLLPKLKKMEVLPLLLMQNMLLIVFMLKI